MRGAEKLGQAITWFQVFKIISKDENIDGFCSPLDRDSAPRGGITQATLVPTYLYMFLKAVSIWQMQTQVH